MILVRIVLLLLLVIAVCFLAAALHDHYGD